MKKPVGRLLCACGAVMIRHRNTATGETFLACWRWPGCDRVPPRQLAAVTARLPYADDAVEDLEI